MLRIGSESWLGKKTGAQRTPRFSKTRRKRQYEHNVEQITRSRRTYSQKNKEYVRNYRGKYCNNKRERLKRYWRGYYAKNNERIKQRLRGKKRTEIGKNITRSWAWNQGSEGVRVEKSLVPSEQAVTLRGISTKL